MPSPQDLHNNPRGGRAQRVSAEDAARNLNQLTYGSRYSPLPHEITTKPNIANLLHLISVGPTGGPVHRASGQIYRDIFLNNNAIGNEDGSINYSAVSYDWRPGSSDQTVIPSFTESSSVISKNVELEQGTPQIHTMTDDSVDSADAVIFFPGGLYYSDDKGNKDPTPIDIKFERKLASDAVWEIVRVVADTSVAEDEFAIQIHVPRPEGAGSWQLRVRRDTPNLSDGRTVHTTVLLYVEEIKEQTRAYEGYAIARVEIDSNTIGTDFPNQSFLWDGILCRVPSNYDPVSRTYSGPWDYEFQEEKFATSNPVWNVLELITNSEYGTGDKVTDADLDLGSFYLAAEYCDGLVPDGSGVEGQTEHRFSYRHQHIDLFDIRDVLETCQAKPDWINGLLTVIQDRPGVSTRKVSHQQVVDGEFVYARGSLATSYNFATAWYRDPNNNWLEKMVEHSDVSFSPRTELRRVDIRRAGTVTPGQALRSAKYAIARSSMVPWTVSFRTGPYHCTLVPGQVIEISDPRWAAQSRTAGKLSATSSTIVLDQPVVVETGDTLAILKNDALTYESVTVSSSGTLSTINYTGADLSGFTSKQVFIYGDIVPKKWKVEAIQPTGDIEWSVVCSEYDDNLYTYVDDTPAIPTLPTFVDTATVLPPGNLVLSLEGSIDGAGNPLVSIVANWTKPQGLVRAYEVRLQDGATVEVKTTVNPWATFVVAKSGTYKVSVRTVSLRGFQSQDTTETVVVNLETDPTVSSLLPIEDLFVRGTADTEFGGPTLSLTWTNPNEVDATFLYEVRVSTVADVVKRVYVVDAEEFEYGPDKQDGDGTLAYGEARSIKVAVRIRDALGRYTAWVEDTFDNPYPGVVSNVSAEGQIDSNWLNWSPPVEPDIKGYAVHRGTSSGFTMSSATLIQQGLSTSCTDSQATNGTSYYYKIFAYDWFSTQSEIETGANHAVYTTGAATSSGVADTNEFLLTGSIFKPNDPSANHVSWTSGTVSQSLGSGAGTQWAISSGSVAWTSGIIYIYWVVGDTALSTTTNIATAAGTSNKIFATYRGGTLIENGNGNAYLDGGLLVAQTVAASSVVAGTFQGDNVLTRGLTVRDNSGNVILAAGSNLPQSYIDNLAQLQNSQISINSNGTLTGAGGGSVSLSGLGAGFWATLNAQISAGNISTYISTAAIGSAYIVDLSASKISTGSLAVAMGMTTGGSIGIGAASYGSAGIFLEYNSGSPRMSLVPSSGSALLYNPTDGVVIQSGASGERTVFDGKNIRVHYGSGGGTVGSYTNVAVFIGIV